MYSMIIIFLILALMDSNPKESYTQETVKINDKTFFVPHHNLFGCEKYMLPKLDNAPVHHTFFSQQALEEFYKSKGVDPEQLNHNLDKPVDEISQADKKEESSYMVEESESFSLDKSEVVHGRPRPPLREKGFTHFIHIPLVEAVKDVYENQIVPRVQEEDRDMLMALESMHMTVMVFRIRSLQDLPQWSQVLRAAKKTRINIRGAQIFAVKKNFAQVLYLAIKNAEDLIDRVVSKAIELGLVKENQLSHIKFDKISGTYKADPHLTIFKTKGSDLFDFTHYLKVFKNINIPKIQVSEIRLSMIGTHNGEDYFNQEIVQL